MRLDFDAEPLRSQSRDVLERICSREALRRAVDTGEGRIPELDRRMAELAWLAAPFPETYGGAGLGMAELSVLFEEMGRVLAPSAALLDALVAGFVLLGGGDEEQCRRLLPPLCRGAARAAVAVCETTGRWDAGGVRLEAAPRGNSFVLRGTKVGVLDADLSHWMVVAARTSPGDGEDGLSLFVVDSDSAGVSWRRTRCIDPTRRTFEVRFDEVRVSSQSVVGRIGEGWPVLASALDRGLVAIAAELCGTAARILEVSVVYAGERRQFGRPIGAFQAVAHRLAEALVVVECARSLSGYAAWALDAGVAGAAPAAAMAKAYCADTALGVAATGIQVHGAMGFTWEHDAHLFYRRARWGAAVFGDGVYHRSRLAALLDV